MARSNHNPAQIADARGRRAALLDPYSMHLLRRHDTIPPDTLRKIAREIGPGFSKWRRRGYWLGFGIGLYSIGSALVTRTLSGGRFRYNGWPDLIILLFLIIWIGGFLLYARAARQVRLRRARDIMLAHLRCPHCGYDIRMLPADPADGATTCPECGHAWFLADTPRAEHTTFRRAPS